MSKASRARMGQNNLDLVDAARLAERRRTAHARSPASRPAAGPPLFRAQRSGRLDAEADRQLARAPIGGDRGVAAPAVVSASRSSRRAGGVGFRPVALFVYLNLVTAAALGVSAGDPERLGLTLRAAAATSLVRRSMRGGQVERGGSIGAPPAPTGRSDLPLAVARTLTRPSASRSLAERPSKPGTEPDVPSIPEPSVWSGSPGLGDAGRALLRLGRLLQVPAGEKVTSQALVEAIHSGPRDWYGTWEAAARERFGVAQTSLDPQIEALYDAWRGFDHSISDVLAARQEAAARWWPLVISTGATDDSTDLAILIDLEKSRDDRLDAADDARKFREAWTQLNQRELSFWEEVGSIDREPSPVPWYESKQTVALAPGLIAKLRGDKTWTTEGTLPDPTSLVPRRSERAQNLIVAASALSQYLSDPTLDRFTRLRDAASQSNDNRPALVQVISDAMRGVSSRGRPIETLDPDALNSYRDPVGEVSARLEAARKAGVSISGGARTSEARAAALDLRIAERKYWHDQEAKDLPEALRIAPAFDRDLTFTTEGYLELLNPASLGVRPPPDAPQSVRKLLGGEVHKRDDIVDWKSLVSYCAVHPELQDPVLFALINLGCGPTDFLEAVELARCATKPALVEIAALIARNGGAREAVPLLNAQELTTGFSRGTLRYADWEGAVRAFPTLSGQLGAEGLRSALADAGAALPGCRPWARSVDAALEAMADDHADPPSVAFRTFPTILALQGCCPDEWIMDLEAVIRHVRETSSLIFATRTWEHDGADLAAGLKRVITNAASALLELRLKLSEGGVGLTAYRALLSSATARFITNPKRYVTMEGLIEAMWPEVSHAARNMTQSERRSWVATFLSELGRGVRFA